MVSVVRDDRQHFTRDQQYLSQLFSRARSWARTMIAPPRSGGQRRCLVRLESRRWERLSSLLTGGGMTVVLRGWVCTSERRQRYQCADGALPDE